MLAAILQAQHTITPPPTTQKTYVFISNTNSFLLQKGKELLRFALLLVLTPSSSGRLWGLTKQLKRGTPLADLATSQYNIQCSPSPSQYNIQFKRRKRAYQNKIPLSIQRDFEKIEECEKTDIDLIICQRYVFNVALAYMPRWNNEKRHKNRR